MKADSEFNEKHQDVLKEIGNIGTGNAVTALSQLLGKRFNIEVPDIRMVEYYEVPGLLGGAEVLKTGIMLNISGGLSGIFLFLLDEEFTRIVLDVMVGQEERDIVKLDDMSRSAICEIGNIMCCSYINALAMMTGLKINVSVPGVCSDMAGAILSVAVVHFAEISSRILLIENKFGMKEGAFFSHILFLPDPDTADKLQQILEED